MRAPRRSQMAIPMLHGRELVFDFFAGGGGASLGFERAGVHVDVAINHSPAAIAMHSANHRHTKHYTEDVHLVNPLLATGGRPVGAAWFSPDCTHFSQCLGGKPRDKNVRSLAWIVVDWARAVRPRVIFLENVAEFLTWGPLDDDGYPIANLAGSEFRTWWAALADLGYRGEHRLLRGQDYGAPTSRERLFAILRCDGEPIVWPEPTHGPGKLAYRTAAECIDFSLPCPSIFMSTEEARAFTKATGIKCKRPLVDTTLRRIATGVRRHVIEDADPFIIPLTHPTDARVHSIREPFRTITAANRGELALVAPTLVQSGYGERPGQEPRCLDIRQPIGTMVAGGSKHQVIMSFLELAYSERNGVAASRDLRRPFATVTTRDHHRLIASFGVKLRGTSPAHVKASAFDLRGQVPTITTSGTHLYEVRAFLDKYYGTGSPKDLRQPLDTLTTHDRFAVVTVAGSDYAIGDIGQRMLVAREQFRAQGFPDSYIIDPIFQGKPLTKTAQSECAGNSVCPDIVEHLVRANYVPRECARAA